MINESQYYYTTQGFSCPEIRVIIQPLPNFCLIICLFCFGSTGNGGPAFLCTKNPPQRAGGAVIRKYICCIPGGRHHRQSRDPEEPRN